MDKGQEITPEVMQEYSLRTGLEMAKQKNHVKHDESTTANRRK